MPKTATLTLIERSAIDDSVGIYMLLYKVAQVERSLCTAVDSTICQTM